MTWLLLTGCLTFLIPVALTLIAIGASSEDRAVDVAMAGLVALCVTVIGYAVVGFGFQYGGLGLVSSLEGVEGLIREWSPLDVAWGPGWGVIGLDAFFILGKTYNSGILTLFFFQVALAATAVVIPALPLVGRAKRYTVALASLLVSTVTYPLFGNWAWGGGWLAQLGNNLELGHGFVDYAGAGVVHAVGGLTALAGVLAFGARISPQKRDEPATIPPAHFPLLMIMGGFLLLVGWFGLALGQSLITADIPLSLALVNLLMAAALGGVTAMLYTWFTTGKADHLLGVRGVVGGVVAISAALSFVPTWGAAVVGAVAGLVVCLSTYVIEYLLRLDDPSGAISMHGLAGLWGVLAVALFADGRYGVGWNGVGASEYLGVAGQGVSGLFVPWGFEPDIPGQLYAQVIGLAALAIFVLFLSSLFFGVLNKVLGPKAETEAVPSEHQR